MISVIMPVYNAEKTLKRAVDSVLSQSFQDFELILIDDGSSDHSVEIADSLHDARIRVLHDSNNGASHARNHGIAEAKGERICFIDSDDEYLPGYLEHLNYHQEDLVICGILYEGEKKGEGYKNSFLLQRHEYPAHMEDIIRKGILNSPVTKLYRTEIIRDNGLKFNEEMKVGEDLNFNFCYLEHAESFYYLDEKLYLYHMDESAGVHRSYIPDVISQRRINIDLLEAYFKENQLDDALIQQLKVKLIYICVMQEMELGTSEDKIWKMIDIPYFHEIQKVQGFFYQILLRTYQSSDIHKICRLGKLIRKLRKYVSSASV